MIPAAARRGRDHSKAHQRNPDVVCGLEDYPRAYAARVLSLLDRALLTNRASTLRGKERQRAPASPRRGFGRCPDKKSASQQRDAVPRARKLTRLRDCTYCRRSRSTSYLSRSRIIGWYELECGLPTM